MMSDIGSYPCLVPPVASDKPVTKTVPHTVAGTEDPVVDRGIKEVFGGQFPADTGFKAPDAEHTRVLVYHDAVPQVKVYHVVLVDVVSVLGAINTLEIFELVFYFICIFHVPELGLEPSLPPYESRGRTTREPAIPL
jgi:hypothetical protein